MIKNKRLLILFSLMLMIILISNVFAVDVKSYKPKYGITTSKVNFRTNSSTSGGIIRTLSTNTNVKIVGEMNNFYVVQLESNEIGFISKDYIKINSNVPKAKVYESLSPYTANIIENNTNVRRGPSTNFIKIATLKKGSNLTVIGKIDNFFVVIFDSNKVGMIRQDLVKKNTSSSKPLENNTVKPNLPNDNSLSIEENAKLVLQYINEARKQNGLGLLTSYEKLNEISILKSNEMVKKDYFSHTSPTYGSPFKMMQNFGITYKAAGENIAGNSNMKKAVDSWIASESHKKNILSNSYNYIGVGVTKSDKYGYIIVTMFIGK